MNQNQISTQLYPIPADPAKEQKAREQILSDYDCGQKCFFCPFPGAQCAKDSIGERN